MSEFISDVKKELVKKGISLRELEKVDIFDLPAGSVDCAVDWYMKKRAMEHQ